MQNKIGIGIPVYNNIAQFRECLKSLADQTNKNFEVIIFDDASSEDYQAVIKDFTQLQISYYRSESNKGALPNMQYAYNKLASSYKYVMIMHEDDLLHPQFIETAFNGLKASDNTGLFISQFEEFEEGGAPAFVAIREDDLQIVTASAKMLCSLFLEGKPLAFGSAMYNTTVYREMNLDHDNYAEFADRPFLLKNLKGQYNAAVIDRPFYSYRSHGPNDNRWKALRPVHVYHLLKYYKSVLHPGTQEQKRKFKKQATAFIFESIKNLQLAGSFNGYVSYLWGAFRKKLLSLKYALLRNNILNHAGSKLKKSFNCG